MSVEPRLEGTNGWSTNDITREAVPVVYDPDPKGVPPCSGQSHWFCQFEWVSPSASASVPLKECVRVEVYLSVQYLEHSNHVSPFAPVIKQR